MNRLHEIQDTVARRVGMACETAAVDLASYLSRGSKVTRQRRCPLIRNLYQPLRATVYFSGSSLHSPALICQTLPRNSESKDAGELSTIRLSEPKYFPVI